ncbi:ovochymase-like isoform X2 [Apostichopus japonicus]
MVAGWGSLPADFFPIQLRETGISLLNQSQCMQSLGDENFKEDVMLCGSFKDGSSEFCQGDSGGPLMCKDDEGLWNVVGISSGDSGCEGPSTAVFTRVTAYTDFISSFLNKEIHTCEEGEVLLSDQICDFEVHCNRSVSDERDCDHLEIGFELNLTSPNYPRSYRNSQHQEFLMISERGSHLSVRWLHFQLETGFDYVHISFDRERYISFTGNSTLDDFVSPSNILWVLFTSDSSVRDEGFAMHVEVVPGNGTSNCTVDSDCSGHHEICNMSKCQCLPGFFRAFDMCLDIDECAEFRPCEHKNSECVNLEGSYQCSCRYGYEGNGTSCQEVSVNCGTITDGAPRSRIVGGTDAYRGNWPWMGSLQGYYGNHVCGATLINPEWAVTAAHCVGYFEKIVFGDQKQYEFSRYHQESQVQVFVHPEYDGEVYRDIAVLHLQRPVRYSHHVSPVCLPDPEAGGQYSNCWIAGWGTTEFGGGETPDILQEANINLFNDSVCEEYLQANFISDYMICAGLIEGGKDTCQGDSGGPMVCEGQDGSWQLVGATSWGFGCGDARSPGVYTKIEAHLEFIQETINEEYFHCDNGDIIARDKKCDFYADCADETDESRCAPLRDGEDVTISYTGCRYGSSPQWIFRADRGLLLRVSFISLELGSDSLEISSNSSYTVFTGSSIPEDRAFPGPLIRVSYFCEGFQDSSFSINVLATSEELELCDDGIIFSEEMRCDFVVSCSNRESAYYDEKHCDLLSDGDTITIQSPQYPARYPNNTVVQWLFQAEEGHHFELTFPEFDLEELYDYLTVGNGSHIGEWDETVFSLTGLRPEPVIAVNNNVMWMEFSSDSIISGDGFVVEIHVVEDIREVPCIHYIEGEDTGELFCLSPTRDDDCLLVLVTSKKERFKLEFDVDVDCSAGEHFTLRTSTKENSYCGVKRNRAWWSDDNVVIIDYLFTKDRRSDGIFALRFSVRDDPTPTIGCNRFFSGPRGSISSPRYPDDYSDNRVCETRILAEPGQRISLSFEHFRMQGAYPICGNDYMEIEDLISGESVKWCGNQRDPSVIDLVSDSFYLKVTFSSNRSKNFQGYYGKFSVL